MNHSLSVIDHISNAALRVRYSSDTPQAAFNSLEFEGIGNAAAPNSFCHIARTKPTTLHGARATSTATPLGSNTRVVGPMLQAETPSGSNAHCATVRWCMTPEGSQHVERECPHSVTTSKGSQPVFRVRDSSGKPTGLSSGRGLAADSPTALHLNAGTPTPRPRSA